MKTFIPREFLRDRFVIREAVRQYRLRTSHPDWTSLLDRSPEWREALDQARHGSPVLIATTTGGYFAATHIESLLGVALTLRGARVHVLLCDGVLPACLECNSDWYPNAERFSRRGPAALHCHGCFAPARRVFESIGATVHTLGELLNPAARDQAARLAAEVPRSGIAAFRWEGLAVGEHAMAGALRFYARATLAEGAAEERVLRRYLESAILSVTATRRLLADTGCAVTVCHHGIYVPHGLIGEVSRAARVRVVNWHVAYRKQTFLFSHADTYHHTLMHEPVSTWDQLPWTAAMNEQLLSYLASRWDGGNDWISFHRTPHFDLDAITRECGVDFSRPVVGMLTSVMWDAQLHYRANAFPDQLAWILATVRYFAERPDLQLLIRVHPAEITGTLRSRQPVLAELGRAFPRLPPNVFVLPATSQASTYAAMAKCNAVLIYGTKTGVELTSVGIPVIVAGEAWIRNKGITIDASSEADYVRILDRLPLAGPMSADAVARARRYAYHFFFRRMIPLEFIEPAAGLPGFRMRIDRLSQLSPGASLGLDVICDGVLSGRPFVYPAERLSGRAEPVLESA